MVYTITKDGGRKDECSHEIIGKEKGTSQDAYAGLDSVQEPDLIDSYIYQLNAAYLRYRVLLRDVKALTSDEVHQTPHIDSEIHIPTFDLETRALSDLSPGSNTF